MRHHQNVLKKPDPKLCYQWKRGFSRGEKALADFFIGDRLQEFGYDLANDTPPFFSLYRYAYVCREGLLWRYKNLTNSRRGKGSH